MPKKQFLISTNSISSNSKGRSWTVLEEVVCRFLYPEDSTIHWIWTMSSKFQVHNILRHSFRVMIRCPRHRWVAGAPCTKILVKPAVQLIRTVIREILLIWRQGSTITTRQRLKSCGLEGCYFRNSKTHHILIRTSKVVLAWPTPPSSCNHRHAHPTSTA